MFKKLGQILAPKFCGQGELSRQLEIVKIFDLYKKEIKRFLPPQETVRPLSIKNKILVVVARNSIVANELQARESVILEKINLGLGKEVLKKAVYRF